MSSLSNYWPIVLCIGAGTYAIRVSFILILSEAKLSDTLMRALRFIPATVLAALIVPAVFAGSGELNAEFGFERPIAASIAFLIAWKTRNVLATIATGLVSLWLLQWLLV